jgi:hypothetical protein
MGSMFLGRKRIGRSNILGFRFVCIGTKRPDRATGTARALGQANAASVVLQQMAKPYPLLFWHDRSQIEFDLVWIGVLRESKPLR